MASNAIPTLDRATSWVIRDRYLEAGRLRLRSMQRADSAECVYKLCKKFSPPSPHSQAIVNIYLSRDEYEFLGRLPGPELVKSRYRDLFGAREFGVDVFSGELDGLILCEIEASSVEELLAIEFPAYARIEVTEDPFFTGAELSRVSARELAQRLHALDV